MRRRDAPGEIEACDFVGHFVDDGVELDSAADNQIRVGLCELGDVSLLFLGLVGQAQAALEVVRAVAVEERHQRGLVGRARDGVEEHALVGELNRGRCGDVVADHAGVADGEDAVGVNFVHEFEELQKGSCRQLRVTTVQPEGTPMVDVLPQKIDQPDVVAAVETVDHGGGKVDHGVLQALLRPRGHQA